MPSRSFQIFGSAIALLVIAAVALPAIDTVRGIHASDLEQALLILAFATALLWLIVARSATGPLRSAGFGGAYARGPLPAGGRTGRRGRELADGPATLDERLYAGADGWPSNRGSINLAVIFAIAVGLLFLPYPYESGGTFNVMPYDHYALPARVSGEVTEVLVHEGEWVKEGQVVGTLSDWTEVHSLAVAQSELELALANLQNLLITPKPEEVEVAQRQYEQALARVPFSKEDYERKLELVKTNDISVRQFQLALSTYQQDMAAVNVTKANYDLVRVGPTQAQIAAARAQVHHETDQVSYWKDQLERTRIRATAAGQVVTPDPQLLMGQFLQEGTTFIALEDHRIAHVEVQVPETDIRDIHLGGLVRAKAWGYEYTMWLGKVTLIAPDAQYNQPIAGNIVRVVAEIPNPDGLLRPTMSGDAKVETVDMPVWMAYTRALMRFFLIEIWYWIP